MQSAIKNKIRSRKGASISFALLAFLVCAIISIVVIVAGSTAAGRMSQIAQSDQRYYAVNSAAELLRSTLDKKVVSEVKTTNITTTTEYDSSGEKKTGTGEETIVSDFFYTVDISQEGVSADVADGRIVHVTEPSSYSLLTAVAYELSQNRTEFAGRRMTLSATASPGDDSEVTSADLNAALTVDIYQTVDGSGTLTFYVSKGMKNGETVLTNAYTLRLTFAADIQKNTLSKTDHGTPELKSGGSYTVTDTTTKTETMIIKWMLVDIVKDAVPPTI